MDLSPSRARLRALGCGALLQALLVVAVRARQPLPEEPLILRWLRVLADHPLRGASAWGLLFLVLVPGTDPGPPPRASEASDPPSKRDGAPSGQL